MRATGLFLSVVIELKLLCWMSGFGSWYRECGLVWLGFFCFRTGEGDGMGWMGVSERFCREVGLGGWRWLGYFLEFGMFGVLDLLDVTLPTILTIRHIMAYMTQLETCLGLPVYLAPVHD